MPTVTLTELRTRVRKHADMESSTFVTDDELTGYLNRALWALDDKLHTLWEDYYAAEVEVSLSGTSHTLPEDFYKLVGVDVRQGGGGDWVGLKPYALAERNAMRNLRQARPEEQRYRIQGTRTLHFLPGFSGATTAIISYYPQRAALVDDGDSVEYPHGWEEWAVLQAAIVCLTKEERDTTAKEKLLALENARVEASAPVRDVVEPFRVVDTESGADCPRGGPAPWRK